MQEYWVGVGESAQQVQLPSAEWEIMPGIKWGRAETPDTPAYWAIQCRLEENPLHGYINSSGNLVEEIGFCLLGGFGITAEINEAAFTRLRAEGVFDLEAIWAEKDIRGLLTQPLDVQGRMVRYRFPNQRAKRISNMRKRLCLSTFDGLSEEELLSALSKLDGIGPKTAAWIVRNHCASDKVAILDIHVIRACKRIGIFPEEIKLPRDYSKLQETFLDFADQLQIRASVLDAVMWKDMRSALRN